MKRGAGGGPRVALDAIEPAAAVTRCPSGGRDRPGPRPREVGDVRPRPGAHRRTAVLRRADRRGDGRTSSPSRQHREAGMDAGEGVAVSGTRGPVSRPGPTSGPVAHAPARGGGKREMAEVPMTTLAGCASRNCSTRPSATARRACPPGSTLNAAGRRPSPQELETLIASHRRAGAFIEAPALAAPAPPGRADAIAPARPGVR